MIFHIQIQTRSALLLMEVFVAASPASHFALVLPGAVARGAYEAGVIEVLTEQELHIDRIVATSSGALNGIAYAAGIRAGNEKEMAARLVNAWIELGGWQSSINLSPLAIFRGKGLANSDGIQKMMRQMIHPCGKSGKRDVELHIVVTPLNGGKGAIGDKPATTYEQLIKFSGPDFDTQEGLERIFTAVTAACAFPGVYEPVEVEGFGPCIDGGAVNNAPIRGALTQSGVNRVIMPVPFPAVMPPADWKSGGNLLNHLIEILINERLYRELKFAQVVNRQTDDLKKMLADGEISQKLFEKLQSIFLLGNVEITEIRPLKGLEGGSFSGFFHKRERMRLIEEGREATRETLAKIPAYNPTGEQTT
jgi:predicted acylesterase/phospholipase RssA